MDASIATMPADGPKRLEIIDAATRCFRAAGFADTKISDIAGAAGVGKGTVYEYFSSKEEVLLQACLHCCQQATDQVLAAGGHDQVALMAAAGEDPYGTLRRQLRAELLAVPRCIEGNLRLFTDLLSVARDHPNLLREARAALMEFYQSWLAPLRELVGRIAGPRLSPESLDTWVMLYTACIDGLGWQIGALGLEIEQHADAAVEILITSLGIGTQETHS